MPITLITGPANAGKAPLVMDAVRRHLAHGEEPLLIVPTRADTEHYVRELAGERAAMGVRVERFDALIEEAVHRGGVSERLLSAVGCERLLAAIAGRSSIARAAGAPVSPGLVDGLRSLFAELQVRRVTPARLKAALAQWASQDGPDASQPELGRLFEEYLATLERMGRVDAEQRAVRALDALRLRPASWGATPVLFYGFDDLTRLQLDAIETLGRVVDARVAVSLTYEPGRTAFAGRAATFAALAPLAAEHRELGARADYYAPGSRRALSHLERSLFETTAARVDPAPAVRLLEGGGERAELELVARELLRLLRAGMAPEEIALVLRASPATADLLEEVLSAAGIPFALQRRRAFADTATGRALIGLLRCAGGVGELGDLLAWLRAPGLLEHPRLADSLEIRARRVGAKSAAQARKLWQQRHWSLDTIDHLAEASVRGAPALIERAARELQWLFAAPRRRSAEILSGEEADEARALVAGRRALAELRELARIAPELAPGDGPELARALEAVQVLSGERPGAGAVAVLDPLALRARRVRALFVCGLQEGVFPARPRPRSFLAEEQRRRLAETSGLTLGEPADALAAERYLLYAALSRPQEQLVLSWHVADDDGEPTARSLFVDDVCDLFDEALVEARLRRPLGAADAPGVLPDPVVNRADADADGDTDAAALANEDVLAGVRERPWSASSLETWIGCPMRWFIERVLEPGAFEPEPEPFARGGLAHAALRDTLEGLRARYGSARITPARLPAARELLRAALERSEAEYPLSVAPERRPGVRRRLRADLERYLQHAAEAPSALEPAHLELGFGIAAGDDRGEESSLPAFDLGGGVRMRGRIDRVDVDEGGEAIVYDYKSGVAPASAGWVRDGKLQVGLYMLAVEQLLGLRAAGGFYQPLSGSDLRPRGVLDGGSGVELECVRGETLEHAEVRELLAQTLAAAREAAVEAARGELQARPQTCGYRGSGCRYPTICRCERR
jgi:ATP-dependent helicase/DNAse subunit B